MANTRARLSLVLFAASATLLTACMTKRVEPQVSQAVLDARAGKNKPVVGCSADPLSAASPAFARFGFNDASLNVTARTNLDRAAAWLVCHPQAPVAIIGAADGHGTAADQEALAARRARTAAEHLTGRGVAAERIQLVPRGQTAPAEAFVIHAEGLRW